MIGSIFKQLKDKTILTIKKDNEVLRKVEFIIGNQYIINPINKNRKRNVGRTVTLQGIESDRGAVYGKVKYLDTKRPGKIELDDLDYIQS